MIPIVLALFGVPKRMFFLYFLDPNNPKTSVFIVSDAQLGASLLESFFQ
jgi:hypothetical protein